MSHTPFEVVRDIEAGEWVVRHEEDCGYISLEDAKKEAARLNAIEAHRDRAVNSHDALVAACKAARNYIQSLVDETECDCNGLEGGCVEGCKCFDCLLLNNFDAALALAEGKGQGKEVA